MKRKKKLHSGAVGCNVLSLGYFYVASDFEEVIQAVKIKSIDNEQC